MDSKQAVVDVVVNLHFNLIENLWQTFWRNPTPENMWVWPMFQVSCLSCPCVFPIVWCLLLTIVFVLSCVLSMCLPHYQVSLADNIICTVLCLPMDTDLKSVGNGIPQTLEGIMTKLVALTPARLHVWCWIMTWRQADMPVYSWKWEYHSCMHRWLLSLEAGLQHSRCGDGSWVLAQEKSLQLPQSHRCRSFHSFVNLSTNTVGWTFQTQSSRRLTTSWGVPRSRYPCTSLWIFYPGVYLTLLMFWPLSWSTLFLSCSNLDPVEKLEKRMPKEKLFALCRFEPLLNWVRRSDYAFYQALVEVLIPDVLRPIPSKLLQYKCGWLNVKSAVLTCLMRCCESAATLTCMELLC